MRKIKRTFDESLDRTAKYVIKYPKIVWLVYDLQVVGTAIFRPWRLRTTIQTLMAIEKRVEEIKMSSEQETTPVKRMEVKAVSNPIGFCRF